MFFAFHNHCYELITCSCRGLILFPDYELWNHCWMELWPTLIVNWRWCHMTLSAMIWQAMKTTQINTAHRSNVTLNKRFRAVIRLPTTKFLNGLPIPIVCLPCLLLNTCKRGNNTPPTRSIVDLSQVKPNRLSGIYGVDLGVKISSNTRTHSLHYL